MEINKLLKLANYFYKMATPLESLVIDKSVPQSTRNNINIKDYQDHYKNTTINYRIIFVNNDIFKLSLPRSENAYSTEEIKTMIKNHNIIPLIKNVIHMGPNQIEDATKEYEENNKANIDLLVKDLDLQFLDKGLGETVNINIMSTLNNKKDIISPAAIDHDTSHAIFHSFNEGNISKKNKMREIAPKVTKAIKADFNFPSEMKVDDKLCNSILRMILIWSNIISGSIGELQFRAGADGDLMPDMLALYNLHGEKFDNLNIKSPGLYIYENEIGHKIVAGKNAFKILSNADDPLSIYVEREELMPTRSDGRLINLEELLLGQVDDKGTKQDGILNDQAKEIKRHLRSLNGRVIVLRSGMRQNLTKWILERAALQHSPV
jgi:hypothetical protein